MTPTNTTPSNALLLERIEQLREDVKTLQITLECQSKDQRAFELNYTKAHEELKAEVRRVDDKAGKAHERIDALSKAAWSIAVILLTMALSFLWAVITNQMVITVVR